MKISTLLLAVLLFSKVCNAQDDSRQENMIKKLSEYLSIDFERASRVVAVTRHNIGRIDSLNRDVKIPGPEKTRALNSLIKEQNFKLKGVLDSSKLILLMQFYEKENISQTKLADMKNRNDLSRKNSSTRRANE